jgi:hypothetical protein
MAPAKPLLTGGNAFQTLGGAQAAKQWAMIYRGTHDRRRMD